MGYYRYDGGFWIRIFGWGLSIKDTTKNPMVFSERNGYVKFIKIGKYLIKILKP